VRVRSASCSLKRTLRSLSTRFAHSQPAKTSIAAAQVIGKSQTHPERDHDIRTVEGKTNLNSRQATRLMRKSVLVVTFVAVLGSKLPSAVFKTRGAVPHLKIARQRR